MPNRGPELLSAVTRRERRIFIVAVGVVNLAFLVVDLLLGARSPVAVLVGRVLLSALFFGLAARLGRPITPRHLDRLLGGFTVLVIIGFALFTWGTGGTSSLYFPFFPLIPLVLTVAIPDVPLVPLVAGFVGGTIGVGMESADGASGTQLALWFMAFASSTFYGWAGTFLFRRMRESEAESEREQRKLQERLAVSSRLAAMGTLVAGVAHEVNNPLGSALASDGFAVEEVEQMRAHLRAGGTIDRDAMARQLDAVAEALHDAQESQKRIAGIVKDLAILGKTGVSGERIGLARVVEKALRWVPPALQQGARIVVTDDGAPEVVASEGQLIQVVANLLTNAIKAAPAGRPPDIRVRVGRTAVGRSLVEVTDDGEGMTPAVMERIFDPFFTTRMPGHGSGLGLAICHAIVTAYGGEITVESTVDRGSTFRVELPAAPDAA